MYQSTGEPETVVPASVVPLTTFPERLLANLSLDQHCVSCGTSCFKLWGFMWMQSTTSAKLGFQPLSGHFRIQCP